MSIIKKKRVSKKTRAAWRKYADIEDVEEFLEDQRREERLGNFSEKKDEELFTIDAKSSDKLLLSARERRRENARKPAKNLTSLVNTSKVEDPLVQRNRVKLKRCGRNLFEELENPKKSQRVVQSLADRKKYHDKLDEITSRKRVDKIFQNDAWEEQDIIANEKLKNDWISRELALHHLKNLGKPLVKLHSSAHDKTSKVKAFEPPHPGISYNPTLKDHQDLLKKVVEKEEAIIKQEKHLKRVTTDMFSKLTPYDRDMATLKELSSGLPVEGEEHEKDEENNENVDGEPAAYCAINPPVQNKKKDRKARRKQREQRELQQKLLEKKAQKKQITEMHKLKHLSKEADEKIVQLKALRKKRREAAAKKKFEPKRISKIKYEDPDIDVNMSEDIAGSLRNIKPESSLLVDRFKNFQKRNILPPSVDVGTHKRRKIKRFVRNTHKEVQEPLNNKKKKKINVIQ